MTWVQLLNPAPPYFNFDGGVLSQRREWAGMGTRQNPGKVLR